MIRDRETLERIFTLVKNTKKAIVKIYPDGTIIGTDEQFASLNILVTENVDFSIDIPYIFMTKEITAFMRNTSEYKDHDFTYTPYGVGCFHIPSFEELINHFELSYQFDELYYRTLEYKSKPILYSEENFQSEMFTMKSDEGAKIFNVNKDFLMTSFNAIHPATKSDKVDLIIRDCDIYSFTGEFIINKKKDKYQLHEFLRFRKL